MDLLSGTEIFILEEKDYKKANEFYNNKIQTYINDYENQKSKYRNDYENQKTKHQNEKTALDHRISEINAPMEEISKKINNLRLTILRLDAEDKELEELKKYIEPQIMELNKISLNILKTEGYLKADIKTLCQPVTLINNNGKDPEYKNVYTVQIPSTITSNDRIYLAGVTSDNIQIDGQIIINFISGFLINKEIRIVSGDNEMLDITNYIDGDKLTISIYCCSIPKKPGLVFNGLKLIVLIPQSSPNYNKYINSPGVKLVNPVTRIKYISPISGIVSDSLTIGMPQIINIIKNDKEKIIKTCLSKLREKRLTDEFFNLKKIHHFLLETKLSYDKTNKELIEHEAKKRDLENKKDDLLKRIKEVDNELKLRTKEIDKELLLLDKRYNLDKFRNSTSNLSVYALYATTKITANKAGDFTINLKKNTSYWIFIPYISSLEQIYWLEYIETKNKDNIHHIFANGNCHDLYQNKSKD